MNKKILIIVTVIIGFTLIVGFIIFGVLDSNIKIGYVGNNFGNKINGSFKYFDGSESKTTKFNKNDNITITYNIKLEKGQLNLIIKDKSGNEIMNKSDGNGKMSFKVSDTQNYTIKVIAKKAKGNYSILWSKN